MLGSSVKSTFAIHEVVVLSGFSKHMLDYLAREDIVRPASDSPAGKGRRRRYSYADIVVLRALSAICEGKGKIRHLADALGALRQELGPLQPGHRLDKLLFVNGDELCLRTGAETGRELRSGQLTLSFVIDLESVTHFVDGALIKDKKTGEYKLRPKFAEQAEAVRQEAWETIRQRRQAA